MMLQQVDIVIIDSLHTARPARPRWVAALLLGALFGVVLGLALSAPQSQWTRNQLAPVTSM